jgi:hypothetical protein
MIAAAWAPLAVVLVLSYLLRHQEQGARQIGTGALALEYGTPWKIVGIAVGAAWTAIFAYLTIESPPTPDDVPAMLMLIGLATGTLVPYVVTVYGVSYRLTEQGIQKRSPWSRNFAVAWHDVTAVTFNQTLGQFIVDTKAGRIRISRFLNGLRDLRAALQRHVDEARWSAAKKYLDMFTA